LYLITINFDIKLHPITINFDEELNLFTINLVFFEGNRKYILPFEKKYRLFANGFKSETSKRYALSCLQKREKFLKDSKRV